MFIISRTVLSSVYHKQYICVQCSVLAIQFCTVFSVISKVVCSIQPDFLKVNSFTPTEFSLVLQFLQCSALTEQFCVVFNVSTQVGSRALRSVQC